MTKIKYNVMLVENHKAKKIMQTVSFAKAANTAMALKMQGKKAYYKEVRPRKVGAN